MNRSKITEPDLWFLYRQMLRSRLFEEEVQELWEKGLIYGEMHMGLGEEAVVAGIVAHLRQGDAMVLDHRGTPPLVMRGVDLSLLIREFLGRADGLCSGRGGHMHLFSKEHLAASSGIVGASGPMAVGFALASQHSRSQNLTLAFFGEGAMNQGMLLESLNLAVVWKLPLVFICKDNELAITTHSPSVTGGNLIERVKGFGMPALEVDGTDVESVWKAGRDAARRARRGEGPSFLLCRCLHFEGHFLGDPLLRVVRTPLKQLKKYAGPFVNSLLALKGSPMKDRLQSLRRVVSSTGKTLTRQKRDKLDPLRRTRQKLEIDRSRLKKIEEEVNREIEQAVHELSKSAQL